MNQAEDPVAGTVYTLSDRVAGIRAEAAPHRGFLWSSLCLEHPQLGPTELLYRGGDFAAALRDGGMSPVLFPTVGRLKHQGADGVYLYKGKRYPMGIHGFAKNAPWGQAHAQADPDGAFVRAHLYDTPDTRAAYPFAFQYLLTYRVSEGSFFIDVDVHSEGSVSLGFHPYFNAPLAPGRGTKADCALRVPARKHWVLKDLVPTGQVRDLDVAYDRPEGVSCAGLDLDQVFTGLVADPDGLHHAALWDRASGIRVDLESALKPFSEIVVYAPSEQPYVCIEHWTDPPNILNREDAWATRCPSSVRGTIRIQPSLLCP